MAVDINIDDLTPLPPPGPSQLEIRFRRLLHRCTARAAAAAGAPSSSAAAAAISSVDSAASGGAGAGIAVTSGSIDGGDNGGGALSSSGGTIPWRSDPKFHAVRCLFLVVFL
jgi:hypothetical protein